MFPSLFHSHHSLHSDDIPFWLEIITHHGGPILELGCGTGRVTIPIAKAGNLIYGMDNSSDMLAFLRKNITSDLSNNIILFLSDFTNFHLAMKFGSILLPCNTLSTLTEQARRSLTYCVSHHLQPDGIFAASLANPNLLRSLPTRSEAEVEDVFLDPIDGVPVQVSSSWKRTQSWFDIHWFYDRLGPDGSVERHEAQVRHYVTDVQVYITELISAGFNKVLTYGDFDAIDFTPDSPCCILVASK